MAKIFVASPPYKDSIGGIIVLHKLVSVLNKIGHEAYLTTIPEFFGGGQFAFSSRFETPFSQDFDRENDIIVYPEIVNGNPLGGKKVVRYILNNGHRADREIRMATWGENDYWLYLTKHFYDNYREENYLHIIETKLDLFQDYGFNRTQEACFNYGKQAYQKETLNQIHPKDSPEVNRSWSDENLVRIFNTSKRFYSYDYKTYLTALASLCGCESVIVPHPETTREEVMEKQPGAKYGISWGVDPEELERAKTTKPLLKEYLTNLEEKQYLDTRVAFDKIKMYFNV